MGERRGRLASSWVRVVLLGLCFALIVVGYGLLNGWSRVHLYGRGLIFVGLGLIGFGLLTSIGNSRATTDAEYLEVRALTRGRLGERVRGGQRDYLARFGALFLFVGAGVPLRVAGMILGAIG